MLDPGALASYIPLILFVIAIMFSILSLPRAFQILGLKRLDEGLQLLNPKYPSDLKGFQLPDPDHTLVSQDLDRPPKKNPSSFREPKLLTRGPKEVTTEE
eukprot:2737239-Pyramimonas_sp.AAC.1